MVRSGFILIFIYGSSLFWQALLWGGGGELQTIMGVTHMKGQEGVIVREVNEQTSYILT